MKTIQLPKKLYVKARECGSKFTNSEGGIIDMNTCFWNCLYFFFTNILRKEVNIYTLKQLTTDDLPFNYILVGNQDPSRKGGLADHRVIMKTVEIFRINICLLTSGTHIYFFDAGDVNETMYLFLHKNHFRLVDDDIYIQRIMTVLSNPNSVMDIVPEFSNSRRKRGKVKEGTFRQALVKGNTRDVSLFETNLKDIPEAKKLFESPKRKRGRRKKRN